MIAGAVRMSKSDIVLSTLAVSIYSMTRPYAPLRHRADSGAWLSGFPIQILLQGRIDGLNGPGVDQFGLEQSGFSPV